MNTNYFFLYKKKETHEKIMHPCERSLYDSFTLTAYCLPSTT